MTTLAPQTIGEADEPQSQFGAFLKMLRRRIPPETVALGSWRRLPVRCGRRVSQEEIAEAVGVSRNWYRRLESGSSARASTKLLDRLAAVFAFTTEERIKLFVLAIPEIGLRGRALVQLAPRLANGDKRNDAGQTGDSGRREQCGVIRLEAERQLRRNDGPRDLPETVEHR
jgi:transcriptional regulator with XRE-family HTH domain